MRVELDGIPNEQAHTNGAPRHGGVTLTEHIIHCPALTGQTDFRPPFGMHFHLRGCGDKVTTLENGFQSAEQKGIVYVVVVVVFVCRRCRRCLLRRRSNPCRSRHRLLRRIRRQWK